jgi:U3 small nucleolar RNA-associated protein 13
MNKNYKRAIKLAFILEQPYRILTVFQHIIDEGKDINSFITSKGDQSLVDEVVKEFSPEQVQLGLQYMREWNTNAKHSLVAQIVLKSLLSNYPPSTFEENPKTKEVDDETFLLN